MRNFLGFETNRFAATKHPVPESAAHQTTEQAQLKLRKSVRHVFLTQLTIKLLRAAGVLLCLIGVLKGGYNLYFENGKVGIEGTVVDLVGAKANLPSVEFVAGESIRTVSGSMPISKFSYSIGDQVGVLYDPAAPDKAQINTFRERWLFAALLVFVGFNFLCLSFIAPVVQQIVTNVVLKGYPKETEAL
ncbi:DUF3592 domain-containing protein [Stieleria sp. JC731]|uniref:DUF3592 domain-containing protein n=1 Tax=Pirellulaceae TaxID=2691357 RepID=UPI001E538486|nr:DUF3592 domain-containing protein [Stieleria sp. JC731]MCC9603125.1 DUF3592 domain-containing protein [Stieleria sp. JC731]